MFMSSLYLLDFTLATHMQMYIYDLNIVLYHTISYYIYLYICMPYIYIYIYILCHIYILYIYILYCLTSLYVLQNNAAYLDDFVPCPIIPGRNVSAEMGKSRRRSSRFLAWGSA